MNIKWFLIVGVVIVLASVLWAVMRASTNEIGSTTNLSQESVPATTDEVRPKAPTRPLTQPTSLPDLGAAPELLGLTNWINSEGFTSMEELRGKVVLVDFWTLGCINCIRTLPHVTDLYRTYEDQGFVILGLHAPEFAYERKIENVREAVTKHGITYPVAQDNEFATWRNYNNRYWPAHYLIDRNGRIRYQHFGEGQYQQMRDNVAALLAE